MLAELRVHNLLLIERAELVLDAGLNLVTGETGAGKTMLAHALDLLLGGRPRKAIVRPGADEAYVEGVFAPPRGLAGDPELAELAEQLPLEGDELVLGRRVTAEGRTRAYVQGRLVTARELRAVGSRLVAFFGQHEHRKLTLASAQLEVLDGFCGADHLAERARFERAWRRLRQIERELAELREREGARERDLDLLDFEVSEIEAAAPGEREERELEAERSRLAAIESLRMAAGSAIAALDSESEGASRSAVALLASAEGDLARARGHDAALDAITERLRSIAYELGDLARELRSYDASLEAEPGRLEQVEERLDLFAKLKRKHGGSITSVLEHAERCRAERARLALVEEAAGELERELKRLMPEVERLARSLGDSRRRAARGLERAVSAELAALAMGDAAFEVRVAEHGAGDGTGDGLGLESLGAAGADAVEFLIAPNPGVPAGALREIASGGELSRVMLALMSAATVTEGSPTVVFDEVDASVGGNTARAVGERLQALAGDRQILCITHLPQVAALAARHFRVVKDGGGQRAVARARVERLEGDAVVAELCRMLGADAGDRAAKQHAQRLLQAA